MTSTVAISKITLDLTDFPVCRNYGFIIVITPGGRHF